jgi:hypothetical protein
MRAARRNQHKNTFAAIEGLVTDSNARALIPMKRPGRAWQKDDGFALAGMKVIPANGSRQSRSQMHVGNAAKEIESILWERKAQAPGVAVVANFGKLDLHVSFSLSR